MTQPLIPDPGTAPTGFEGLRDNRLLDNSNFARRPTNDREWNTFIQELNKWVKNETGFFVPTFGAGFSAEPSDPFCWWHRYGQMVSMKFDFGTGTSDAAGFTITNLPENITPKDSQQYIITGLHDGGVDVASGAVIFHKDGQIIFHTDGSGGTWVTSSDKGFVAASGHRACVIYSLRNPPKL